MRKAMEAMTNFVGIGWELRTTGVRFVECLFHESLSRETVTERLIIVVRCFPGF
jgi:hypothetical protein